ncbi:leucine-rich repeat and transmembrane domain-containing protein 1 [Nothobranchius furzeri]|uniref:Leucine-rich repeats and transmembrane domains 1 n=3 Tax=Nothobranchius TaxID=28779 RepID=A0A1A8UDQ1_NOTFU|nr:leucine-rich repeat and transmembrane domain-containing protein 1 [Nothobranchius furzeri]KAF7198836.1 leucine-rich repeats and transmembrane domains 1 [Nothobranchius furzeri]
MQTARRRLAEMRVILVYALLCPLSLSHGCPKECSCNSNTKVVDCRGRGLFDIPRRLDPETQELHLQDNRIRGLGSMAFREIPRVRILDLSNNSITSISPTALLGLRTLQHLSLAYNSLRELDKRLLGPIHSLSHLDLSHNSLWGLPGAIGESLRNVSYLGLANNRLTRLDRTLLEAVTSLDSLTLRGNPWRCDCQILSLKLWLETYLFKGGVLDEVLCFQPEEMKEKDLQKIPYQLFHTCMTTSYHYLFANIQHLESERLQRGHTHGNNAHPSSHSLHVPMAIGEGFGGAGRGGGGPMAECEPKQKQRPVNLRHAIATVIITGVVCGIVCLMMLAAAVYGCAYAAIMAKYQRELKKNEELAAARGAEHATADEKEPLENAIA